ncbi:chaperone protein dnaJ 20, chloroplastic-like [Syzygium oleosum]|uniref:chaperone protein dnaJ 20, chloroplastic-like n=1 Tax=Syzygium oleosum TaxID=219896 RepID=UPI0024B90DF9|nr:chaperone protein dnaJ 20, chloroplastic-like [Syzygium oleosum]
MRSCYGIALPGSDPSRLCLPPPPPPPSTRAPLRAFCPTRVRFGPVRCAAGRIDDGVLAGAALSSAEASFYDLLGIPESGSLPEIKQAYKQLARKYHPDVSPPGRVEEYTQRFIRVQEAYETLSDPRRRAVYDRDLARGIHLAFSARRPFGGDEDLEDKSEWKSRWQVQLSGLKRRSNHKDSRGNMSWGARMRRQMEEPSDDS